MEYAKQEYAKQASGLSYGEAQSSAPKGRPTLVGIISEADRINTILGKHVERAEALAANLRGEVPRAEAEGNKPMPEAIVDTIASRQAVTLVSLARLEDALQRISDSVN